MLNTIETVLLKLKFLSLAIATSVIYYSCTDMDSIHDEYLNGETIYAGQLDTLNIRPGYYRAQLEGYTQFLGTSNQLIIEFNGETQLFPIGDNLSDIFSVIVEDLEEGSYEFTVSTQDPNGNLSVSQVVAGSVVGDEFVTDQDAREVLDFSFEPEGDYVNFYGNAESEYVIYTLIDYENEDIADIVTKIEFAIEQHPSFLKVLSPKDAEDYMLQEEELNKKREFWSS